MTALFADIKGSMELMEDLDPEEARTIVDPALKLMIDAVDHYDGYVVQSTSDGIFALFGAPVARRFADELDYAHRRPRWVRLHGCRLLRMDARSGFHGKLRRTIDRHRINGGRNQIEV